MVQASPIDVDGKSEDKTEKEKNKKTPTTKKTTIKQKTGSDLHSNFPAPMHRNI